MDKYVFEYSSIQLLFHSLAHRTQAISPFKTPSVPAPLTSTPDGFNEAPRMRSLTGGREMRAMRSQSIHSTTRPGRQQAPEVEMDARLRLENERLKQVCGAWADFCI